MLVRDAVDIGMVARPRVLILRPPHSYLRLVFPASRLPRVFVHQLPPYYEFWSTFRPLQRLPLTNFDLDFYEPFDLGTPRFV